VPGHRSGPREGRPSRSRPRPWPAAALPAAVAAVALLGAARLALVDPARPGHYPGCPVLWATGRYCPGCGGLRAVHELLHGSPSAALHANALVVLLIPVALLVYARWTRDRISPRRSRGGICRGQLAVGMVLTVGFGVLRNLPAGSFLAP